MVKKIITILLALGAISFLGCNKTVNTQKAPQVEILTQDSNTVMEQMKANLVKANDAAKSWKANAQFYGIVLKIYPELKENALTETYVFGSNDDSQNWWTYSISEQSQKIVRATVPKEDYLGTALLPINETYWKISYIDALKTAESGGGLNFRAQNPEAQIYVILARTQPKDWLWWQVNYLASNANLSLNINAADNQIYDANGVPVQ